MATTKANLSARHDHIIERPRLTRMLDESKAKVILLLAPAGYGKTTLARQWLKDKPHVWYRASEADVDVAALAVGIATQAAGLVAGIDTRIRQRMRAARNPEREAGAWAELIAEDFSQLPVATWIVIDDYHHVGAAAAGELFVQLLVDSVQSRLLLTSRTRPTWATARSVVYGRTAIIGRDDLAMTERETAQVVGPSQAEAASLFAEVMGWPAVIGLAARVGPERIQGQPLLGDLYDFFAEELWRALPGEHQWQLAQLSLVAPTPWIVADDLFGDAVNELIASVSAEGWVSRDEVDIVIHPLLRRFLQVRFESYPAARRRDALTKLIHALAVRHKWDQAISLALQADEGSVSELLGQALDDLLESGRLSTLERWLEAARDQAIDSPVLKLAAAEVAFRRGDYIRAEGFGQAAARQSSDPLLRARSLNRAGVSATMLDHLELGLSLHRQAQACAPDRATLREAIIGEIGASLDLGHDCEALLREIPEADSATDLIREAGTRVIVALRCGKVGEAVENTTVLMPVLADVRDPLVRSSFLYSRSVGLSVQAMFREALSTVAMLDDEVATFRIDLARIPTKLARALAEAGLRHFDRARKVIADLIAEAQREADIYWLTSGCGVQARIEAGSGSGRVPPYRPELARTSSLGAYQEYLACLAIAAASAGERSHAERLVEETTAGFLTSDSEVLLSWVRAILGGGRRDVLQAFDFAWARGVLDAIVIAYRARPQFIHLLFQEGGNYRQRTEALLLRSNDLDLARELGLSPELRATRHHRLTPREREVYSLMAEGLSNRRIAEQLVISESTAKLHVRHILEKLCARSRAEAVAKWRDVLDP
ncbi:MAG: LuxR C-terminal-related transcriptional regulator [Gaiellaceae bacterium]